MRAADDFHAIRERIEDLQRERIASPKHDATSWRVQRVPTQEIAKVAQEKTRELLSRT